MEKYRGVKILRKNYNKTAIKKLSKRHNKVNRTRNIFTIVAIILTTVLFTTFFTIGGSLFKSVEESNLRKAFDCSYGDFSYLTTEEYEILREHKDIKEYGTTILVALAENDKLAKRQVEICYIDENEAKYRFISPLVEGYLPTRENEIVLDTISLDLLGLEKKLNQSITLNYRIFDKEYSKDFILSGYYQGSNTAMSSLACVSREFIDKNISHIDQIESRNKGIYTGTYSLSIMLNNKYNIEKKLVKILIDNGFEINSVNCGVNWAYLGNDISSMDLSVILATIALLTIIFVSGYVIIYNIFYLSIVKDTKYYGLLKTIGTTSEQIKKIVIKQAIRLSYVGIPIGLMLGYGIGIILLPYIMQNIMIEYTKISANPIIFIGSALFSLVTVFISSKKPAKLAAKISPIEAIRYTGIDNSIKKKYKRKYNGGKIYKMAFKNILRDKKKATLVIVSLSISIIILNFVYTMVSGFDLDSYLVGEYATDFTIGDTSFYRWRFDENNINAVTEELCGELENLNGVGKVGRIYYKELVTPINRQEKKLLIDKINELNLTYRDGENINYHYDLIKNEDLIEINLYGLSDLLVSLLEPYIIEGEIDTNLFKTGDYIISKKNHEGVDIYKVGDKVTLSSKNGYKKEYTVMAIIENLPLYLQKGIFNDFCLNMYMSSTEMRQYGEEMSIMTGMFDVEDEYISDINTYLKAKTKQISGLDYRSKETFIKEFDNMVDTYNIAGYTLSFIIGLIGLINFANVSITSIISRRKEFATMQSIGMTKKQLKKMLFFEGLYYSLITIGVVIVFGTPLNYIGINAYAGPFSFFTYKFTVLPILICLPILVIISLIMPKLAYSNIKNESVVERLREVE